jgi:hypothetical protein
MAIDELHAKNDFGEMTGVHYLNEYNGTLYDFGKGTNTIAGIYLLKHSKFDKYTITLTNKELALFKNKYERTLTEDYFKRKIKKNYIGILNI